MFTLDNEHWMDS